MEFPRHAVINLLEKKGCSKFGDYLDHEIWVTEKKLIIRIPKGNMIHYDHVEAIALDILGMGNWDFDYWIGQTGLC